MQRTDIKRISQIRSPYYFTSTLAQKKHHGVDANTVLTDWTSFSIRSNSVFYMKQQTAPKSVTWIVISRTLSRLPVWKQFNINSPYSYLQVLKVIFLNILRQVVYLQETVRELQCNMKPVLQSSSLFSTLSIFAPSSKSVTTQKSASRKVSQNTSQTKVTSLFKMIHQSQLHRIEVRLYILVFLLGYGMSEESHLSPLKSLLTFGTSKAQA